MRSSLHSVLALVLFALSLLIATTACSSVNALLAKDKRIVPGPCPTTPYPSEAIYPPITEEITGPDGHSRMCLVGLSQKPKRWIWTLDGKKLAYEIATRPTSYESQLNIVNVGELDSKVIPIVSGGEYGATWELSPDGQFVRADVCSPGYCRMIVTDIQNGQTVCGDTREASSIKTFCPLLRLSDGRWWSANFPRIILKTDAVQLWDLIRTAWTEPEISPNGLWMIVGASGGWYIASTDGRVIHRYSMPTTYSGYGPITCVNHISFATWRPDSKRFAVFNVGSKQELYVWEVQNDGNVRLAETIPFDKCPVEIKFSTDGTITTR